MIELLHEAWGLKVYTALPSDYDEIEASVDPTVCVEFSPDGGDLLPPRAVTVVAPQDYAGLASNEAERIIVHWPAYEKAPRVSSAWWLRLARRAGVVHLPGRVVLVASNPWQLPYLRVAMRAALKKADAGLPAGRRANDRWDVT